MSTQPPGPSGLPVVGNFLEARKDTLAFLTRTWKEYGDVSSFQLGPWNLWLLVHPEHLEYTQVINGRNYEKHAMYESLEPVMGKGLITSNGDQWRAHRKLLQPVFRKRILSTVSESVVESATRRFAVPSESMNLGEEMAAHALEAFGRSFFGTPFESAAVTEGLPYTMRFQHKRVYEILKWPLFIPTPANRRYNEATRGIRKFVVDVLEERADGNVKEDLMGLLCGALAAGQMTVEEVRDQVATLILASHETTGLTLTWFWYLMGQHPEVYEAVQEEVLAVTGDVGVGVAQHVPLLQKCIWETLRLYPPTWWFGRCPIEPDSVAGFDVQPGQILSMCPFLTHRHPDFWPDPEAFAPGRHNEAPPRDGRYFPFALGPRRCAGEAIAMLELVTSLVTFIRCAEVQVCPEKRLPVGGFQLRPDAPILATVHRR